MRAIIPDRHSARSFLTKEEVLGDFNSHLGDERNSTIIKTLYRLQGGRGGDGIMIPIEILSEETEIGTEEIRERLKGDLEFLPLLIEYEDKWAALTPVCISYLEEEGIVDLYRH